MKERSKILFLSIIVSAILTCFIAISILSITAQHDISVDPKFPQPYMMKKINEGSMLDRTFFPLDILAVISMLLFIGLSMVFYVVIKYIIERKK